MSGSSYSNGIALSLSQRNQLMSLRDISTLSERTQNRLTSGREVDDITDSPMVYFQAMALTDRATNFDYYKDKIDQGISTMTAALEGLSAIEEMLTQMKGIAEATKSQTLVERKSATTQFLNIGEQVSRLIEDTSYAGINLLNKVDHKLDVVFSERTTSRLIVAGYELNSTSAGSKTALFSTAAFDRFGSFRAFSIVAGPAAEIVMNDGSIVYSSGFSSMGDSNTALALSDQIISIIDTAISRTRASAAETASSVALLTVRLDYTNNYTENLNLGSDKMTLADINQEGANMVALQTRYEIGLQALAVSGQQHQKIVALIS